MATPGSLRLLVPSRREYELLYGALAVLAVMAFLNLWFLGVLPIPSPLGSLRATDPRDSALVVLVTIAAGSSIAGALGALYRYRVRHRPGASVALTVSEILPKGNHVFIRVSDGADPYWLSVTRPSAYTNEKPWHRYVRETLDLAGQPLQGGEAIRVANGTDSAGPQESSTPPGP